MTDQLGLFGVDSKEQPARSGRELRDKAVAAAVTKDANRAFVDAMRAVAYRIAREKGEVSANDLRDHAERHGITPPHPNLWGAVFLCNGFEFVRFTESSVPCRHGSAVRVWKLAL